jgi:hypothetical protein
MCQGRMARTKSMVADQTGVRVSWGFLVLDDGWFFDGRKPYRPDGPGWGKNLDLPPILIATRVKLIQQ